MIGDQMRVAACLVVVAAIANVSLAFAGGTDEGMTFADLSKVDRVAMQLRFEKVGREPIGGPPTTVPPKRVRSTRRDASFIALGALNIDPTKLLLHRKSPEQSTPLAPTIYRLNVAGVTLDLLVVDYVFDPTFHLCHLAAVSLDRDADARFTVSGEQNVVVGTVRLGDSSYRIRAAPSNARQIEYRISTGSKGRYARPDLDDSIARIEARHVEMAMVADAQPRYFATSASGAVVTISEGLLGQIPIYRNGALLDDARMTPVVQQFVAKLSPLTGYEGDPDLILEENINAGASTDDWPILVGFHQLLNGIAVEARGFLQVKASTGEVLTFVGRLFQRSDVQAHGASPLQERDALTLALDTIAAGSHVAGASTVYRSELLYVQTADDKLRLAWLFAISVNDTPFTVRVDAITGEGEILRAGGIAFREVGTRAQGAAKA